MRRLRSAATLVLVAGLGLVLALRAYRGVPPAAKSVAARTPDQVRTEEIFRANANRPGDPALAADYESINAEYFDNRLPAVRLRWEPRLGEVGPLIAEGFRMGGVTDGTMILLNPAIQADAAEFRRVLCHEIVHVAVVSERDAHGPMFQQYLRSLLLRGAFKGIVASEEEKQARRQLLDRKLADLTADAGLLERMRASVEADPAHTDAAAYTDRARRHNDALVEFNRDIEEYNQMVSYPDGLDRQRLARQTGAGG